MPSISIIIPFSGSTGHLIADLSTAVQGADEVIIIDNACDEETRKALQEVEKQSGGIYIRNDTNLGFAAANNQGYATATKARPHRTGWHDVTFPRESRPTRVYLHIGEWGVNWGWDEADDPETLPADAVIHDEPQIIMFLNSDVAAAPGWLGVVKHDVRTGALYGPSLAQQLVYGMWLPYLEGWCIAATRETWDGLCNTPGVKWLAGPWDALSYPDPYWEDNDLCLRAIQADIPLIHTRWASDRMLAHKGGQTVGAILKHGASFERNRATFAERVRRVWEAKMEK